jgi:hypothetical protein
MISLASRRCTAELVILHNLPQLNPGSSDSAHLTWALASLQHLCGLLLLTNSSRSACRLRAHASPVPDSQPEPSQELVRNDSGVGGASVPHAARLDVVERSGPKRAERQ